MKDYPFAPMGPALNVLALVVILGSVAVAAFVLIVLGSLPGRIAARRRHPQAMAVNVCGWLGLPSGIVWVLAIVWAFYRRPGTEPPTAPGGSDSRLAGLLRQIDRLEAAVAALERKGGTA